MSYPIKENSPTDKVGLLVIGGLLIAGLAIGSISYNSRKTEPYTPKPIGEVGKKINNTDSTISLQLRASDYRMNELPISSRGRGNYHYTLEVIYEAEDPEFWEIEQVDDTYYRVRREDHDPGMVGIYEFDVEEPIGDVKDLYEYAKSRTGHSY